MSGGGMNPGRPRIEEREAHLIWNGTRILTHAGVEWTVIQAGPAPDEPGATLLITEREGGYTMPFWFADTFKVRCRVEDEDR